MNERLEAFSDGVFAIAITLLILDMKVPPVESIHSIGDVWYDIVLLWPSFLALVLSFVFIFVSWLGHHNLLRSLDKTSPQFQIANGFFLFTVIIIPFPTSFMAEFINTPYAQPAIVFYCLNAVFHNIGWNVLHIYIRKPVLLVKTSLGIEHVEQIAKGSRLGFIITSSIAVLAWWLPYVALALSFLIWVYWIYLSVTVEPDQRAGV